MTEEERQEIMAEMTDERLEVMLAGRPQEEQDQIRALIEYLKKPIDDDLE